MTPRIAWLVLAALAMSGAWGQPPPSDLKEWWSLTFLRRLRAARQELAAQRLPVLLDDGLEEYRAVIHCHSLLSHDSRGTLAELIAAARETDTQVVMMTEHPSQERDVYAQGWHGLHEGVLFVPGAETRNLLVWPRTRRDAWESATRQAFVDRVRADGGLVCITHQDTFDEWELQGVHGLEIYNIHVDAEDDPEVRGLLGGVPDFLFLMELARGFNAYPLEAFAAIFDEPRAFVERWESLLERGRLTAIAGNDAHQNTGFVLRRAQGPQLEVWSVLEERLAVLDLERYPFLQEALKQYRPGDEMVRLQLDPYPISFQFVGTHLLAPRLDEAAVREALAGGRAFVAFDWLADARGFTAIMFDGDHTWRIGDEAPWRPGLRLRAEAPLPVRWRLLRDGQVAAAGTGRSFEAEPAGPGIYRVEASIDMMEREWPWIYANPFYLTPEAGHE